MRLFLRFIGWIFAGGTIVFLVGVTAVAGLLWHFSRDLPDYSQLQDYEPAVMTRVHAADGQLLAEYARERRLYLPIQAVPRMVINAFIAAEDKSFYEHGGLDFSGIARAGLAYIQNYGSGRRPQGASTITQQVAKNFLLTNEVSMARKIKEALLAMKIERAFSKEKILELYLNEIYLGIGAYGVAAASLLYFNKSVHELTLPEAAYLAALPKGPNNYHPFRRRDDAIARRNYVIDRMVEDRFITAQQAEEAKRDQLVVTTRSTGAQIAASEYFAEEVRRYINDKYSEKKLYEGGLSVRTTLDPAPAEGRAQVADRRPREVTTRPPGLSRRDPEDRSHRRLGRAARRHQGALRYRAVAACGRPRDDRPGARASASSPAANRAARWSSSATTAPSGSTACAGRSRRPVRRAAACRPASRRRWKSAT